MTEGEWRLRAGLLKDRLASYGLSVVRFVCLPGLEDSELGGLLKEAGRQEHRMRGDSSKGAPLENLHLTLLPVLRSRFALPEDRRQAEACLAELADLVRNAPEDGELRQELARLEEATSTNHRRLQALLEGEWQSALSYFRKPGLPRPRAGGLTHPLPSFDLELAPSGHLILLLPDLLGDREWARRVSSGGRCAEPERTLHVTLLHIGSRCAFDWLTSRLTEPVAGGGPIWLGHAQLVSYRNRALDDLTRSEALSGSRALAEEVEDGRA